MKNTRIFSCVFKIAVIICCLIGILSTLLRTTSLQSILSFYTTQSNLVVLTFYIGYFIVKHFNKNIENSRIYYFLKGAIVMIIMLTLILYTISLYPNNFAMDKKQISDIFTISNLFVHFITPIMVLLDYIFFDEKGHFNFAYPFMWYWFPCLYILYVYTYSSNGGRFFSIGGSDKYAYFFLDIEKIGIAGVLGYITLLSLFFIFISFMFVLLDKSLKCVRKLRYQKTT